MLLGLLVIACFYSFTNWHDYIKPWLDQNKGYVVVSSPQRSAILISDRDRARFLRWLDAYLPDDAAIVMPPGKVLFSSQSVMQNFLFPRPILACCGSDETLCKKCVDDPDNYILAIDSFPLPEDQPNKVFVAYPQGTNSLRGVYVPDKMIDQLSMPALLVYGKTIPISIRALLTDFLIICLMFVLGGVIIAVIFKDPGWGLIFENGIPLSMGIMSWSLFILSFFGVRLTWWLVLMLFFVLMLFLIVVYRVTYGGFPKPPGLAAIQIKRPWRVSDGIYLLIFLVALLVFSVVAFLSIARGYSTGDDIINWSFKGYAMVDSGTIWAGNKWGGHVLAYPMNLQLSIGMFRLLDGDVIPGSKSLFVILVFSLLFGCYRFLTHNHVNRIWAISGILTLLLIPMFLFHATIGFANLPFTVYLILGILASLEGLRSLNKPQIALGGTLIAFAGWTRPEGFLFGIAFLTLIYLLIFFVLKIKLVMRYFYLSLLPVLIIPGSWLLLLGNKGMGDDQIGLALKALMQSALQGNFKFEVILTLGGYFYKTFYNTSFILLFFWILILVVSTPLTHWHRDKFKLSLALLDILAFLLPAFMFFVASFNEKDFIVFLDQSFDRAFLPALTMTMLVALLAISKTKNGSIRLDESANLKSNTPMEFP